MSHESDSEDDSAQMPCQPDLAHLLGAGDDSSEDEEDEGTRPHSGPLPKRTKQEQPDVEPKGAPSSSAGLSALTSLLPSADDLLESRNEQPDFLKQPDGLKPEFDASKSFKPPSPALVESVHEKNWRKPPPASLDDAAAPQRVHPEESFGQGAATGRPRGSVRQETDDERGRRVVYGAHAATAADPWSQCNPNFAFRSFASGKKRRPAE